MCLSERKISELPQDCTRTFKRNMVGRYIDRPDSVFRQGKFSILNSFCFAEFLRHYYIVSNNENKKNDYQPEQLTDKLVEFNHCMNSMSLKVMPLMNSS